MATSTKKTGKARPGRTTDRWSGEVTAHSDALDLERSVFTWKDPRRIARSLKHSAEESHRRKSDPYRSAMSMLTFYINRAGENLSARQRRVLEEAKEELRAAFGKDAPPPAKKSATRTRASPRRVSKRRVSKSRASKSRASKNRPSKNRQSTKRARR